MRGQTNTFQIHSTGISFCSSLFSTWLNISALFLSVHPQQSVWTVKASEFEIREIFLSSILSISLFTRVYVRRENVPLYTGLFIEHICARGQSSSCFRWFGLAKWTVFSILIFLLKKGGVVFYANAWALTSSLSHYGNTSEVQHNTYGTFSRALHSCPTILSIEVTHIHFCRPALHIFIYRESRIYMQEYTYTLLLPLLLC